MRCLAPKPVPRPGPQKYVKQKPFGPCLEVLGHDLAYFWGLGTGSLGPETWNVGHLDPLSNSVVTFLHSWCS